MESNQVEIGDAGGDFDSSNVQCAMKNLLLKQQGWQHLSRRTQISEYHHFSLRIEASGLFTSFCIRSGILRILLRI